MEMQQKNMQVAKKRPREESSSGEGSGQQLACKALQPGLYAEPPLRTSSDCDLHGALSSKETAQSPCEEQPVPKSANEPSVSVTAAEAIVSELIEQTNGEAVDDVEELLMRALEEELAAHNGNANATATVFQDVEEDDNYDESEEDEE